MIFRCICGAEMIGPGKPPPHSPKTPVTFEIPTHHVADEVYPYVNEYGCGCSHNRIAYNRFNGVACKCTGYPHSWDVWPTQDEMLVALGKPVKLPVPGPGAKRKG